MIIPTGSEGAGNRALTSLQEEYFWYKLSEGQLVTYIKFLKDSQIISLLGFYPKEIVLDMCKI